MLKQLFLTLAILISVTGFISCSKDEPNNGGKDPIENPTDDPKDDPADDPTDDPKDDPADDGTVIVNADGTTSNGMPFRRIDETHFMLNYVQYWINHSHLVTGYRDDVEIAASLKGKVTIVPAVTIDGTKYYTREIGGFLESDIVEIELPSTITRIQTGAFERSRFLKKIIIPENVKSIGDDAFRDCSSLCSVLLNDGIETIGKSAFAGCTSLSSIELNEGLETLGKYAFSGCTKLETITIPENVCIGLACFRNVPLKELVLPKSLKVSGGETNQNPYVFDSLQLKNIYVNSKDPITPEGMNDYLFADFLRYEACLNVPEGSSGLYKKSKFWGKFIHIKEYNPE